MIFNFSFILVPFCFLLIEFHCTFSISFKILPYDVYFCTFGENEMGEYFEQVLNVADVTETNIM